MKSWTRGKEKWRKARLSKNLVFPRFCHRCARLRRRASVGVNRRTTHRRGRDGESDFFGCLQLRPEGGAWRGAAGKTRRDELKGLLAVADALKAAAPAAAAEVAAPAAALVNVDLAHRLVVSKRRGPWQHRTRWSSTRATWPRSRRSSRIFGMQPTGRNDTSRPVEQGCDRGVGYDGNA